MRCSHDPAAYLAASIRLQRPEYAANGFQNNEEDLNTVRDYLATLDFDSMDIKYSKMIVGNTYIIGYTYIGE